jgi:hypothetical protein
MTRSIGDNSMKATYAKALKSHLGPFRIYGEKLSRLARKHFEISTSQLILLETLSRLPTKVCDAQGGKS